MPYINQLPVLDQLSGGDQLPVYSPVNGDARRVSITALLDFFRGNFADPDYLTLINAPTNSGFNWQLGAQTQSLFLILNPSGAFAAGTITLPPVASCFDGQEILVASSQSIAILTVAGNGATLVGVPGTLGIGGFFTIRFNALQGAWYTLSSNTGLRRTAPVTKTADFTLADAEDYIINNKVGSACVVTLPAAGSYTGRVVTIKTIQAQAVNSASSNVIPRVGGAAGTAILTGTAGNWATLVSNGTNWEIMSGS